jgi:hypothetical protein
MPMRMTLHRTPNEMNVTPSPMVAGERLGGGMWIG